MEIGDESGGDPWIRVRSTASTNRSAFIQLIGRQTSVDEQWSMIAAGSGLGTGGLRFTRGDWTTGTVAMTIDSSSNIGIGTTAPTRLLTLSGSGVNNRVQVNNTASGKNFSFYAADDGTSVINYGTAAPLLFTQSGTEFMRITTNGGIAFGGSANYGGSGQILVSAGDSSPIWTSIAGLSAGNATTATNLNNGLAGQIPYQTAPGQTAFVSTGTTGNVLVSNGSSAPTFNNTLTLAGTTSATNTTTGALQVKGGVGVGGSVYVGNRVGFVNTSNVSMFYQYYNAATNSLDTVFG